MQRPTSTLYCTCETPIMDVEHDAGCRRCGLPVDYTPSAPAGDPPRKGMHQVIGEALEPWR